MQSGCLPVQRRTEVAEVILICGKICCGKSTYAAKLLSERQAVLLSVDDGLREKCLALFEPPAPDEADVRILQDKENDHEQFPPV